MKAITYINTKSTIPRFTDTVHLRNSRGYAYETATHFVHTYGKDFGFHIISVGLTAMQQKSGTLEDWVINTFGALNIETLDIEVGHAIEGVWRPALYYYEDTYQALNCSETDMRLAEQSLRLLIDKLDELFLFIEPDINCLDAFSHKTRELLILACTEVENSWTSYMRLAKATPLNRRNFTTKDYVKLIDKLHLKEYQFRLKSYKNLPAFRPFEFWDFANPSSSLSWYDAYNKTKHDRTNHFAQATLKNCINAVVANLIMHCVKFSPIPMLEDNNVFASLMRQHFTGEMIDCTFKSFYLHSFIIPSNARNDLFIFDPRKEGWVEPFKQLPLVL